MDNAMQTNPTERPTMIDQLARTLTSFQLVRSETESRRLAALCEEVLGEVPVRISLTA